MEALKGDVLDWAETTGSARKWWETFEEENRYRPTLGLRIPGESARRKATVTGFVLASVYSNTDTIRANRHYLDNSRLKEGR